MATQPSHMPWRWKGEEIDMPEQSNKPAGAFEKDGSPRPAEDQQAVKNQSTVTPEDYPEPAKGETSPPDA